MQSERLSNGNPENFYSCIKSICELMRTRKEALFLKKTKKTGIKPYDDTMTFCFESYYLLNCHLSCYY